MSRLINPQPPSTGDSVSFFHTATQVDPDVVDWNPGAGWALRSQCPSGGLWCCGDTEMDPDDVTPKVDPNEVTPLQFKPFLAYQVAGCNAGTSRTPANKAEAQQSATDWMSGNLDGWLTTGLEIGICENVGLTDLEDVTDPRGASMLNTGITILLRNRRNAGLYDRPTLLLPDWLAPALDDNVWITRVANVVLGAGLGIHPDVAAEPGEAWIYITGEIEYSVGSRVPMGGEFLGDDLTIRRQNRTWELSETMLIYRFDPCGGFKALITTEVE